MFGERRERFWGFGGITVNNNGVRMKENGDLKDKENLCS